MKLVRYEFKALLANKLWSKLSTINDQLSIPMYYQLDEQLYDGINLNYASFTRVLREQIKIK